jgi:DNA-binding NtrC family response regulator
MDGTILAIVGDFTSRTRLYHLATTLGVNVDFCDTLGNALGRLRFYNYSGIIIDFDSGSVKPDDAIEALKGVAVATPIIAVVGPNQLRSVSKLVGKEVVACLRRPVDVKGFTEAIHRLAGVSV